jgi:DNA polymerase III epsilon subunit-like protein
MKDLMVDIETMGTGSSAAIIQIGACYFDRKTGQIGPNFLININLEDSITNGFTVDPSTQAWWAKQDQTILAEILATGIQAKQALEQFRKFVRNGVPIWSHATFDFVLLQNALKKFELPPLNYKMARDIRTLVDLSGINLADYDWSKKTHNAYDDCVFQVSYCTDALRKAV